MITSTVNVTVNSHSDCLKLSGQSWNEDID